MYEQRKDRVCAETIHCRPLGLFVGRPADKHLNKGRPVYQAVILKQALEDIEMAYSDEISDIQNYYSHQYYL